MKAIKSIFCIVCLLSASLLAQAEDATASQISIPSGYYVLDDFGIDLNKDKLHDRILVIAKNEEKKLAAASQDYPRRLLIYIGTKNGFSKVADTDKVVLCSTCGGVSGDPYVTLTIRPPYFTVEQAGGSSLRWESYVTFKLSTDGNFYLYKNGLVSFDISSPKRRMKLVTSPKDFGKVDIEDFNIYEILNKK